MYRISPVGWRTETENNITSHYTKLRVITLSDEISRWKCQSKKKKILFANSTWFKYSIHCPGRQQRPKV